MFHGERAATERMPIDPENPAAAVREEAMGRAPGMIAGREAGGIRFRFRGMAASGIVIFTASGRRMGSTAVRNGEGFWDGRDATGIPAPPGLYLARSLQPAPDICTFILP